MDNRCDYGFRKKHEWTIIGTPRSENTYYLCSACGATKPRGEGLFHRVAAERTRNPK